jgi:hypothetical protein
MSMLAFLAVRREYHRGRVSRCSSTWSGLTIASYVDVCKTSGKRGSWCHAGFYYLAFNLSHSRTY